LEVCEDRPVGGVWGWAVYGEKLGGKDNFIAGIEERMSGRW